MAIDGLQWRRWRCFAPLLILPASMVLGADTSPKTIEATYILQMQKFVTVGPSPHVPKMFCYYERPGVPLDESVGQQIESYLRAHLADNSPSVKRFEAVRGLSGCDVFYIPADEESYIGNILAALGDILDADGKRGGALHPPWRHDRLRRGRRPSHQDRGQSRQRPSKAGAYRRLALGDHAAGNRSLNW